jgi:hypothetical protein
MTIGRYRRPGPRRRAATPDRPQQNFGHLPAINAPNSLTRGFIE